MILRNGREPEKTGPVMVAIYVRVSTDKQANKEDGSLDTQTDILMGAIEYRRKTQALPWQFSERIVEGEKDGRRHGKSAKNTDRPGLQRLLELAKAGLIDVILITKIDRISRNVVDFMQLAGEFDQYGVKLVSLRENIDLTTPGGKFQTTIMIALAQHEREIIASRTKEKVDWRASKGKPLGPPPIGYVMKDKKFVIDETYAEHVRTADALYLEHQSTDVVCGEFKKRGYSSPKGTVYTKPMILRMLHNPRYAARYEHEGEWYDAEWPAIRTWETHLLIEKTLARNAEHNHGPNYQSKEYVYLLQGLLRCGLCGRMMSPKPATNGRGIYYPYYACGSAVKSMGATCQLRHLPAEAIDRAVLAFMEKLHLKPQRVEAFARGANELTSETAAKLKQDIERVSKQLANVRMKLTHIAEAIADGGKAVLATVKDKLEALEEERQELEASEARLKTEQHAEAAQVISARSQIESLAVFHKLVQPHASTPERLKALLPRFVDYVVWHSEAKNGGQIEVALFPTLVAIAPDVESASCRSEGSMFVGEDQVARVTGLEPATFGVTSQCSSQLSYTPACRKALGSCPPSGVTAGPLFLAPRTASQGKSGFLFTSATSRRQTDGDRDPGGRECAPH